MTEKRLFCVLCFLFTQNVSCYNEVQEVDIICSSIFVKEHASFRFPCCLSDSLVVTSPATVLAKVLHSNGSEVDTSNIEIWNADTGYKNSLKFIPAGIKTKFPKLIAINIARSGLMHMEKEDMRQFGDDLILVDIFSCKLTVIEDDVFKYNSNLKIIYLSGNPFKYISPKFFQNLLKLENVTTVHFWNSNCIDQVSDSPKTVNWRFTGCDDILEKSTHLEIVSERTDFFKDLKISELKKVIKNQRTQIEAITKDLSDVKVLLQSVF